MSERKTYRVVCPELDVILNLKGLVVEEEMELYNQLREKIRTEAQPIKFDEYKTFIVRKFLIDVDAFFELFPDDDIELMQEGVDAFSILSLTFTEPSHSASGAANTRLSLAYIVLPSILPTG